MSGDFRVRRFAPIGHAERSASNLLRAVAPECRGLFNCRNRVRRRIGEVVEEIGLVLGCSLLRQTRRWETFRENRQLQLDATVRAAKALRAPIEEASP
jgi:hypothetical protein